MEKSRGKLIHALLQLCTPDPKKRVLDPTQLKELCPFLVGSSQQDAHEFVQLLIDFLNEESKSVFGPIFYGDMETTTTCATCGHVSTQRESFSCLPLPISAARRVLFYPSDVTKPILKLFTIPTDIPRVLVGRTGAEFRLTDAFTPDLSELCVLEAAEPGMAVVVLRTIKGRHLGLMLASVPTGYELFENQVRPKIWERMKYFWEPSHRRAAETAWKIVNCPSLFTVNERLNCCNEIITVTIRDQMTTPAKGFIDIRARTDASRVTLEILLGAFFAEVQLDSGNEWMCDACRRQSRAIHATRLTKLPPNLIIELKRFTGRSATVEVDSSPIVVPSAVDMAPYFAGAAGGEECLYELVGVVNHTGTLMAGHYTAVARREDKWFLFNDSQVTPEEPPFDASSSAYILFFAKV